MSSQGFALCFPAARGEGTGISPEMVRRWFFISLLLTGSFWGQPGGVGAVQP